MSGKRLIARYSRGRALLTAATVLTIGMLGLTAGTASAEARPSASHHAKATVVLVHGAWADSSSWDGVVSRLQRDGYPVKVFPTPLRSLCGDSAALRDFLNAISGPIVLVGHSYGGAVVTDAATGDTQVKALVYIDAFAPDTGESVFQLAGTKSALANPDPTQVFSFVPNTLPPTATTDLYVLPGLFRTAFANDLPARRAAVLAATQRPVTLGALTELSTVPAWKSIPSWYEAGTIDKVIPLSQQLMMAKRAGSHIVEQRTSHLPMVSQPGDVDRIIDMAARATA